MLAHPARVAMTTTEPKKSDIARHDSQSPAEQNHYPMGRMDASVPLVFRSSRAFSAAIGNNRLSFFDWHRPVGEIVLALIVFRLCWGLLGSSNVRLASLIHHPRHALSHLASLFKRQVSDTRGHNAAGAWAIVIMLISLTTQAVTGMFIADEDELIEGAFYGAINGDLTDWLYRIHHLNAELIIAVVSIHVVMVFVYWLYAGKNLILPMITGRMRWTSDNPPDEVFFQRWWVGLACLLVVVIALGYFLQWDRQLF